MTRQATKQRTLTLTDPTHAARLDATGIPGDVAAALAALGVTLTLVERLHATGVDWAYVRRLVPTRALSAGEDVAALVTFLNNGMEPDQISDWARLGPLDAGLRLYLKNVPLEVVASFPLNSEQGLRSFLRMLQAITPNGIHVEDVLLWHTAGAIVLQPPYLVSEVWIPWRSAAANHLGMRPAALAAAAGLSVREAVEQWLGGEFDTATLRMMAALRAGSR